VKDARAPGNHSQLIQRTNKEFTETNPSSNNRLQTNLLAALLRLMNQISLYMTFGESRTPLSSHLSSAVWEFNYLTVPGGLRVNFVLNYYSLAID